MMAAIRRPTEAERLAKCRAEFEFAQREGISLADARSRLAQARWARTIARCGTRIEAAASPAAREHHQPKYWWQND